MCPHRGMKMLAFARKDKGGCCIEGYPWTLAGDEARNNPQLMKNLADFDKGVLGQEVKWSNLVFGNCLAEILEGAFQEQGNESLGDSS